MESVDAVRESLASEYPEISSARLLSIQGDFEKAADKYGEVLTALTEKEPEVGVKHALVYLEYGNSLVFTSDKVVLNPELEEDQRYLEDLEIAWEVLEIAKQVFQEHGLDEERLKTHVLLGLISEENKNYAEALVDLQEAFDLGLKVGSTQEEMLKMVYDMAEISRMMGDAEQTKKMCRTLENKAKEALSTETTAGIIEELQRVAESIDQPTSLPETPQPVIPVIDPDEPVQRITIKKKPAHSTSDQQDAPSK